MSVERSEAALDGFYRELGSRIRRGRAQRWTQQQLASRVGMSRAAVANIELGRQRIPLHMLLRFADALETEPLELLPSHQSIEPGPKVARDIERLDVRDQETVLRVMTRAREARTNA